MQKPKQQRHNIIQIWIRHQAGSSHQIAERGKCLHALLHWSRLLPHVPAIMCEPWALSNPSAQHNSGLSQSAVYISNQGAGFSRSRITRLKIPWHCTRIFEQLNMVAQNTHQITKSRNQWSWSPESVFHFGCFGGTAADLYHWITMQMRGDCF